jgi:anti-sigma-K factor RskA
MVAGYFEPMEPRKQMRNLLATLTAGLVIGVLAGFGLGALVLGDDDGARAVEMESTINQASAELEVSDGAATLVARHLPPPPDGRAYMVWTVPPGGDPEPTNALFTPRSDGSAEAAIPLLDGVNAVLVNTEPSGGSDAPTSEPILTATLT